MTAANEKARLRRLAFLALFFCSLTARADVSLTYLGAAGWKITDGKKVVLVDPFFTRSRGTPHQPLLPDLAAIHRYTPPQVDLILVEHSHADHLLDVPTIALERHAAVLGSESSIRVAHAAGIPDARLYPVSAGEDLQLDGVSVRVLAGLHSRLGELSWYGPHSVIPADVKLPMPESGYLEGGTLHYLLRIGGRQILIVNSANYIERELDGLRPDVLIVAPGLRQRIYDYGCRLMRILGQPGLVLMSHHDDTYAPIDLHAKLDDAEAFARELHDCAPRSKVVVSQAFQTTRF